MKRCSIHRCGSQMKKVLVVGGRQAVRRRKRSWRDLSVPLTPGFGLVQRRLSHLTFLLEDGRC